MAEPSQEEQPTRTVELLWGLRAASTRGPKATLNVENIAAAAVEVADTDGIDAVSMQRVAEDLSFTKMSLYRHVAGKADLIAVMIEHAVGTPPDLRSGQGRLAAPARTLGAGAVGQLGGPPVAARGHCRRPGHGSRTRPDGWRPPWRRSETPRSPPPSGWTWSP